MQCIPLRERLPGRNVAENPDLKLLTLFSAFMFICWSAGCAAHSEFSSLMYLRRCICLNYSCIIADNIGN